MFALEIIKSENLVLYYDTYKESIELIYVQQMKSIQDIWYKK